MLRTPLHLQRPESPQELGRLERQLRGQEPQPQEWSEPAALPEPKVLPLTGRHRQTVRLREQAACQSPSL